ncbi:MAG: putative lipid II flippase FtsW [Candidatus Goldiibacteriota bacterium]
MNRHLDNTDYKLLFVFVVMLLFGLIMVYSSSSVIAYDRYGDSGYFFKKQIMWAVIGIIFGIILFKTGPEKIKPYATAALAVSIVMIYAVHFPGLGNTAGGATRWLTLGALPAFQPFEIAKLVYVVWLAYVFSDENLEDQKKIIRAAGFTAVLCAGLILQRDFGGMAIISALFIVMLFISGISVKFLLISIPAFLGIFTWLIVSQPYRLKRIFVYLDPWKDYFGAGWQSAQSLTAIGSGGIFGLGISHSQQKFLYLPTPHTDYIFSIIGEETGIIGAFFILAAFFVILWRGFAIAHAASDRFLKFLACSVTMMFIIQAFVNIGVATSLLPPKGTTLPFISAGGSSLVVSICAAAILLSAAKRVFGERR